MLFASSVIISAMEGKMNAVLKYLNPFCGKQKFSLDDTFLSLKF